MKISFETGGDFGVYSVYIFYGAKKKVWIGGVHCASQKGRRRTWVATRRDQRRLFSVFPNRKKAAQELLEEQYHLVVDEVRKHGGKVTEEDERLAAIAKEKAEVRGD